MYYIFPKHILLNVVWKYVNIYNSMPWILLGTSKINQ